MSARILVCVAWPYANGVIHLGHLAGCYLPPDIFRRFHALRGSDVIMVSGSDMHGTPITVQAEKLGKDPEEVATHYHAINSQALADFGAEYSLFTHTHTPEHAQVVQEIFEKLDANGYLYEKNSEQLYCEPQARFLPDRYVQGTCPFCRFDGARGDQCDECGKTLEPDELLEPECQMCHSTPVTRTTTHLYFRLSAFQERLLEWTKDKDHWRANTLTFTRNWLKEGLEDRPITRDIAWGIEVPRAGYENKRMYVWFEAVMGYLSATRTWCEANGRDWTEFWSDPECRIYNFLAKDNIPFHTIIWPAILMGADPDWNLPYDVPANEYLTFGSQPFSKSRGITLDVPDLLQDFGPDALRFYLAMILPENRDAEFSWTDFRDKVNNELVATLGNLIHRTLHFCHKNFGELRIGSTDPAIRALVKDTQDRMVSALEQVKLKEAFRVYMELAREGNRRFDTAKPWVSLKEDRDQCERDLGDLLHIVRGLAILGQPFLPHSLGPLARRLAGEGVGYDADMPWPATITIARPKPLYAKITIPEGSPLEVLDLRVAKITEIADHPDADSLLLLTLNLGDEERQIVAGLKAAYPRDELVGRLIVVVVNLQPARIRGQISQGMLLAADDGRPHLLVPPAAAAPGDRVDDCAPGAEELPFKRFTRLELTIEGGRATIKATGRRIPLLIAGGEIVPDSKVAEGTRIR